MPLEFLPKQNIIEPEPTILRELLPSLGAFVFMIGCFAKEIGGSSSLLYQGKHTFLEICQTILLELCLRWKQKLERFF